MPVHKLFFEEMHHCGRKLQVAIGNEMQEICRKFNEMTDSEEWMSFLKKAKEQEGAFEKYVDVLELQDFGR